METYVLLFAMATMGAFIAGYSIASEIRKEYFDAMCESYERTISRYAEQLEALRKATACACGLAHGHTGKHAPRLTISPQGRDMIKEFEKYTFIGTPKITSSRIPVQPKKKSTKLKAINNSTPRQKKS